MQVLIFLRKTAMNGGYCHRLKQIVKYITNTMKDSHRPQEKGEMIR